MTSVCSECQTEVAVGALDCPDCFVALQPSPDDAVAKAFQVRVQPSSPLGPASQGRLSLRKVTVPRSTPGFNFSSLVAASGLLMGLIILAFLLPGFFNNNAELRKESEAAFQDAVMYFRAGAFKKSATLAGQAEAGFLELKDHPRQLEAVKVQAQSLKELQEWAPALDKYWQLPAETQAELKTEIDSCLVALEKTRRQEAMHALEMGRELLKDDPAQAMSSAHLALELFELNKGSDWQLAAAHRLLAEVYHSEDDQVRALNHARQALKRNPNDKTAQKLVAQLEPKPIASAPPQEPAKTKSKPVKRKASVSNAPSYPTYRKPKRRRKKRRKTTKRSSSKKSTPKTASSVKSPSSTYKKPKPKYTPKKKSWKKAPTFRAPSPSRFNRSTKRASAPSGSFR